MIITGRPPSCFVILCSSPPTLPQVSTPIFYMTRSPNVDEAFGDYGTPHLAALSDAQEEIVQAELALHFWTTDRSRLTNAAPGRVC